MDIVARLKADPITDTAHTSQLIVESVREIERLRRGLFHALIQAGYTPAQMEPEVAAYNLEK